MVNSIMKIQWLAIVILYLIVGMTDPALGENTMKNSEFVTITVQDIPQEKWDNLAQKKIFFGHQSVGYNIIQGMEQVIKENPNIRLHIVKTTNADDVEGPVFAHDWIGTNMNPQSKTTAFQEIMQKGLGEKADIAFMKLCYVDVTATTDVLKVFQDYRQKMAKATARFPRTKFVHVTVPLTAKPTGVEAVKQLIKKIVKKVIGKPVFDYRDNIARNKFNEMLKEEYGESGLLFDLALLESFGADGKPAFFINDGNKALTLANEYTYDGGHLNKEGSKRIAEQLLIFLANLSDRSSE